MKYLASALVAAAAACALIPAAHSEDFKDFVASRDAATAPGATDYIPLTQGGATKRLPGNTYAPATSGAAILKGNSLGGFSSAVAGADYAPVPTGAANAPLFNSGSGGFTNGTRSGNTTTVVTKDASAPATNDCAKWDANGNLTTSGAGCAAGPGGVSPNGVLGDILRSGGAGDFGTPLTPGAGIAAFLASPALAIENTWLKAGAAVASLGFTPANSAITVTGTGMLAGGGTLAANRTVTLAATAANTVLMNNTGSSAVPVAVTLPTCADSGGQHLNYSSGVFSCGTTGGSSGGAITVTDDTNPVTNTTTLRFDPKNFVTSSDVAGEAIVRFTYTIGTDRSSGDYPFVDTDSNTMHPIGAHTYTLAQAGTTGFEAGWGACVQNVATSGNATITTTTSVFTGAKNAASLIVEAGGWACFASKAGNWYTQIGHYDTLAGAVYLSGAISPTALAGNVDNYNPTGLSDASTVIIDTGASARNITGLVGGAAGRVITIVNKGTGNLTLVNDATSTAANRFLLAGAHVLQTNRSVTLRYDESVSRWRPITSSLPDTGVSAGAKTCADITVGTDGRLTSAASGSCTGTSVVNVAYATLGWVPGVDLTKAVALGPVSTASTITDIRGRLTVAEGSAATLMLRKAASTEDCTAAGNADAQTTAAFDLNGTAPANQNLTLVTGAPNTLAAGDVLCAEITGTTLLTKGSINVSYTTP